MNFNQEQLNELNRILELEYNTNLNQADKDIFRDCDNENEFVALFHDHYGLYLRNKYLWNNEVFTQHPDNISSEIIKLLIRKCKDGSAIMENKPIFINELNKAVDCPQNLDVYSYIASILLDKSYDECTEFDTNNNPNYEGKHNRQAIKLMMTDIFIYKRDDISMLSDGKPTLELILFKQFPKLFNLLEIEEFE